MTIEHVDITDPEIHEPKGASTAAVDSVYVSDGAGSGSFQLLNPYGGIIFSDAAGPGKTFTTPVAYTLGDVVSSPTNLNGFSTNNLGRLTYTGTTMRHIHGVFDSSFKHSTGGGNSVTFAVYKNGLILDSFEAIASADSTTFQRMVLHFDATVTTNDYFEMYLKTPSGNVTIFCFYLFIMGMPG